MLLVQRSHRYLHCPRLVAEPEGASLHLIAWQRAAEQHLVVPLAADGTPGDERVLASAPHITTLTRGDHVRVSDDAGDEQRDSRAGERTWVDHDTGIVSVWLSRKDQRVLVFRARGMAAAPCVMPCAGGTWLAFHHDVREDTDASDVAKWVALRFVDAQGRVFEPRSAMLERDRDREGVEQSFEFPALVVSADGAVALFGRGSHNFYRQDLSAAGFGPRQALSDGEWGSRGRHIVACSTSAGVLVARRERKGIQVDLLAPVSGGAPELVPARVDVARRERPRPTFAPQDPARRAGFVTLFGDIQQHSAHSDGVGSADEVYLRARHRYGDDFVALTDHESFLGKRTSPGEWEYLQQVADRHHAPGSFATLYAYEWTGKAFPGPGHKCVFPARRGTPIVSRDELPEGRAAVQRIAELGGFASPHHIGWTGADEPAHDPVGQPLWEICSCHGCYEHADHPLGQRGTLRDQMVDVMLHKGLRFGFTASSDSHGLLYHHGEARKRDPYRTGLTAVLARAHTREAILEALRARRCYATSGVKILLQLTADGAPMGSEITDRDGARFEVEAEGVSALSKLELVTDRGVLAQVEGDGARASLSATLEARWVYARVVQRDGEMAWSSPVFFGPR